VLAGEKRLVERCLQGDDSAWETIVGYYGKRVYNLCYRYVNRRDEAEDLTQDIFIKVYQNLKGFRPDMGSLQNWILKIGRNLIIDRYRQSRRFQAVGGMEEMEAMNLKDENTPDPLRAAEREEASAFLMSGLVALPPELKEAIILRDLEKLSYQEITDLLAIPEGTVKSRINRGRLELAKLLIKRRSQMNLRM
jgi:RNA polymerase sigma-70 factor, ECF subfamily